MQKATTRQLSVASVERGFDELLRAHQALLDAWYSNWEAEQNRRITQILAAKEKQRQLETRAD